MSCLLDIFVGRGRANRSRTLLLGVFGYLCLAPPALGVPTDAETAVASAEIPPAEKTEEVEVSTLAKIDPREETRTKLPAPDSEPSFDFGSGFGIHATLARLTQSSDYESFDERVIEVNPRLPRHQISSNWFVNDFVFEMEKSFLDSAHELLDEDSVLNGSRFFGGGFNFSRGRFDRAWDVENLTAEERVVYRSGVDAIKETLSQTDAYKFLYGRVQDVELYFNWSLVHVESDFSHVVKLYSSSESKKAEKKSAVVSKIDTRFRLSNLIGAPDRIFEVRGRFLRKFNFSVFPMSNRLELRTILLQGRGYRVGLSYTEEPGNGRLLVVGLTSGF